MNVTENDLLTLRGFFNDQIEIGFENLETAEAQAILGFANRIGKKAFLHFFQRVEPNLAEILSRPPLKPAETKFFVIEKGQEEERQKIELGLIKTFVETVKARRPLTLREAQLNAQAQIERLKGVDFDLGFPRLQEKLGSLYAGRYLIIGARPSVGKTSFMLQLAEAIARKVPTLFYSLEMLNYQLIARLITHKLGCGFKVALEKIESYKFPQDLLQNLFLVDTISLDFAQFREQLLSDLDLTQAKVVFIDYLQLFTLKESSAEMMYKAISAELKKVAKDKQIILFVASQLNRKAEDRGKAILADLRYSGSLEQDCDVALLLHRGIGSEEALLEIAKNRDGETGLIEMTFEGRSFSFIEKDREEENESNGEAYQKSDIELALEQVAELVGGKDL